MDSNEQRQLTSSELWDLVQQHRPITLSDLGLPEPSPDGLETLTESWDISRPFWR